MGEAHGGIGFVDVLSAGSTRPVGIDPQILVVDFDLYLVVDFGENRNGGERGMPTSGGVVGADPHQPMNTGFTFQVTKGIFAADSEGRTFDTRFVAILVIELLEIETMLLAITQVHAQQHRRPILRLGAAGARVDRHDRRPAVVRPRQLELEVELRQVGIEPIQESERVVVDFAVDFADQLTPRRQLGLILVELLQRLGPTFDGPPLLQDDLAFFWIVPEIRRLHFTVELGELLFDTGAVKETPEGFGSVRQAA